MAPHQNPLGVVLVFHDQSQERLTGQAIVDQQARYRALVENSPVGIFHFTNDIPAVRMAIGVHIFKDECIIMSVR